MHLYNNYSNYQMFPSLCFIYIKKTFIRFCDFAKEFKVNTGISADLYFPVCLLIFLKKPLCLLYAL